MSASKTINIELGINSKQRFSIDGDPDRIIELDTKDFAIADRFARAVDRMVELERKWGKILAHDYNKTSNSIIELYQWGVENKFDMKALLRLAEEVLEKALTE